MEYKDSLEQIKELLWSTWDTKEIGDSEFNIIKSKLKQLYGQSNDPECLAIISELHIHKSNSHKRGAKRYALEGLKQDCNSTFMHDNYNIASNGVWVDFIKNNHNDIIEYYYDFIKDNPDVFIARIILVENLIDNYRFDEANIEIEKALKLETEKTYLMEIYKGEILYKKGKIDEAIELWNKICDKNKDNYKCFISIANQYANFARYKEAIEFYKIAFDMQEAPRKLDSLVAMVKIFEIIKDYKSALEVTNFILKTYESDYNITDGEDLKPYLEDKKKFEHRINENV